MSDVTTDKCFGCQAPLTPAPGVFYCATCVAKQLGEQDEERKAFDDFHAYADAVLRQSR